jgi:predicted nucleic acid-binding protein
VTIAADTNVLAHAEGIDGDITRQAAWAAISRARAETLVIPAQVLGELFNVLVRKGKFQPERARKAVVDWYSVSQVVDTTADAMLKAVDLSVGHRLQIWDAVILSVASGAGCRLLLSEDMQDGFVWGGVTIINPFAVNPHPLLAALLSH